MSDPFLITGPALVSFSGGRTSAYMLWRILQAHGGTLPDDVHVTFANTGKEREETLRFVHECATRWDVRVRWIEWRARKRTDPQWAGFEEVGYNSASRNGEPFEMLIRRKQYLPNPSMRYCTQELKIRVMRDFMRAQGYKHWTNAVGLRHDEMVRVMRMAERNALGKERFRSVAPLDTAKIGRREVMAFWKEQPFDLGLKSYEGNCDLCFLKGREKRAEILRERPQIADWWIMMEKTAKCSKPDGARFRKDETVQQLLEATAAQPMMLLPDDDDDFDAECGLSCGGE